MNPKEIVEEFLRVIMIPDPVAASAFIAPDIRIRFTGAREMRSTAECSTFNAQRYRWVKKRCEHTDQVSGGNDEETTVYSVGTLYGEWPDGEPFSGNRYVDRYVLRRGKIVQMDVWNDSAERMLLRAGLCAPWVTVDSDSV
jgi:hypothetical protein